MGKFQKLPSIPQVFYSSFARVYPPDFPAPAGSEELDFKEILKRLAGWPEFRSDALTITLGIIRLLFIPFTIVRNLLKLVTELLPCFVAELFGYAAARAESKRRWTELTSFGRTTLTMRFYRALYYFYTALQLFCEIIHFVGKALTSPIKGIETALNFARTFKKTELESNKKFCARIMGGALLMLISLAITTAAYAFLLPLTVIGLPGLFGVNMTAMIGNTFDIFATMFSGFSSAIPGLATIGGLTSIALVMLGTPVSMVVENYHAKSNRRAVEVNINDVYCNAAFFQPTATLSSDSNDSLGFSSEESDEPRPSPQVAPSNKYPGFFDKPGAEKPQEPAQQRRNNLGNR